MMTLTNQNACHAKRIAFRCQLGSLFILTAVCAALTALYGYFGNSLVLFLLLAAAAVFAITWVIDSTLAVGEIFAGLLRPRMSVGEVGCPQIPTSDEADTAEFKAVDILRNEEQELMASYAAGTCAREYVLRARAMRIQAEIELCRSKATRRQEKSARPR